MRKRFASIVLICVFMTIVYLLALNTPDSKAYGMHDELGGISDDDESAEPRDLDMGDEAMTSEDSDINDEAGKQDSSGTGDAPDIQESEYARLAIANVTNYVNVRSRPDTDSEIIGRIYNGAVAEIIETSGDGDEWFYVTSGNVKGYIKAEFFIYGEEAAAVIDDYVARYVLVMADRLNVREKPDIESRRIGYLDNGEKAPLLENCGDWLKIRYSNGKEGYVAAEYVRIMEEFTYARSVEEERAEREAVKALEARGSVSEQNAPENITVSTPVNTYSDSAELRTQIVEYAMQFLGNRYVSGGSSLTGGTDCSGFTSLIYAEFGYSIGRTPSGQYNSAGRSIDYSEIQPGDIICYGSKSCTHVALYIGDGQIIHSANSRKGVVIYQDDYDTILGIKNVID